MKLSERIFHPDDIHTLKFTIKKTNVKKFNSMNEEDQKLSLEFMDDCMESLQQFKNDMIIAFEVRKIGSK